MDNFILPPPPPLSPEYGLYSIFDQSVQLLTCNSGIGIHVFYVGPLPLVGFYIVLLNITLLRVVSGAMNNS